MRSRSERLIHHHLQSTLKDSCVEYLKSPPRHLGAMDSPVHFNVTSVISTITSQQSLSFLISSMTPITGHIPNNRNNFGQFKIFPIFFPLSVHLSFGPKNLDSFEFKPKLFSFSDGIQFNQKMLFDIVIMGIFVTDCF